MVLIYVCLVILQLAASSCRHVDGYDSNELSKDQISKFIMPLLNTKARKNDIKVQVVPYYNYKSNKKDKNIKQSRITPLGDIKNKKDLPVTVILTDPKYIKRVNKVSFEESGEYINNKDLGRRQFVNAPFLESAENKSSEKNSRSASSIIIQLNKSDARSSETAETVYEEDSGSNDKESVSNEFKQNDNHDDNLKLLKEYEHSDNNTISSKAIENSETNENIQKPHIDHKKVMKQIRNVVTIDNSNNIPIQKQKHIDEAIRNAKSSEYLESSEDIVTRPLENHESSEINKPSKNVLSSHQYYSDKSSIDTHEHISHAIINAKSSEQLGLRVVDVVLNPLENHNNSDINKSSKNVLSSRENIDESSINIRNAKSSEELGSSAVNITLKPLKNHDRTEINKISTNVLSSFEYLDEHSNHDIRNAKSSEELGSSVVDIVLKPFKNHNRSKIIQQSQNILIPPNNSDNISINKYKDSVNFNTPLEDSKLNEHILKPLKNHDRSNISKQSHNIVIPLNVLDYETIHKHSDNIRYGKSSERQGKYNSFPFVSNSNTSSAQYYEDVSNLADEYDIPQSKSKDGDVEKNGKSNSKEETMHDFKTGNSLADVSLYENLEPQLPLKENSVNPEVEDPSIAFIKGGKVKKHEITDKFDEIILSSDGLLNPVKNEYPRLTPADIEDSMVIEEADYRRNLLDSRNLKDTDNKSGNENSKERSDKNERIFLQPVDHLNEYTGKQIFDAIKLYMKKAHESSKSYNLSFLFNK